MHGLNLGRFNACGDLERLPYSGHDLLRVDPRGIARNILVLDEHRADPAGADRPRLCRKPGNSDGGAQGGVGARMSCFFLFRAVSGVGALPYNVWAVVRTLESDSGNRYCEVVQSD